MTADSGPLRILVIAYLCEPGRGSERGAAWGVLRALQTFGRCTLITEPASGAVIGAWLSGNPDSLLKVETVAEPRSASILKRFRIGEFLVYLAWQRRVREVGRRLVESGEFDVVFHAGLSAFWLPSVATSLGLPSVWGPVGGAVTTPVRLWPLLGWKGVVVELVDWFAVRFMSLLPGTRRTWNAANVRIVQNDETISRLPKRMRGATTVMNHAVFHEVRIPESEPARPNVDGYIAWVSPIESRKGPELAIRTLAMTPPATRMIIAGDGPQRAYVEELANELGVADRIEFVGMIPHDRALELIDRAQVVMFTGMREEGGLALAEALLLGTRVVVLANGGAATVARAATDQSRVSLVQPSSVSKTIGRMAAAINLQLSLERCQEVTGGPMIDSGAAIDDLRELVIRAASADANPRQ